MNWKTKREDVRARLKSVSPYAILVEKKGWFWEGIAWFLFLVSFGSFKRERFMRDFATTIGAVVAIPPEWSYESAMHVAVHEGAHVRQASWFGLFIPWVGPWLGLPVFGVLYGLIVFPIFGAVFRVIFEAHADSQVWRWDLERGKSKAVVKWRVDRFARTVSSGAYLWSLPRPATQWIFDRFFGAVLKETGNGG